MIKYILLMITYMLVSIPFTLILAATYTGAWQ